MSSQAAPAQPRYEELRVLGRGGAGTVYLVHDRETGDRLALKRLLRADQESLMRLKLEFRALAGISHPNLVKLYELAQDDTSAFFTMEYLEGEDLRTYLGMDEPQRAANDNDEGAWIARVLRAFEQLATAVRALHAAGILHRDLKPSNVMVTQGRVVVLDFGIALDLSSSGPTITQDKLGSGTPAYMAPEQLFGAHLGEANDWYAFGVMLYEALTGLLPIDGKLIELMQRKGTHDPAPISQLVPTLPDAVAELCMRLLRRAPEERPSGDEVLRVLRAHVGEDTTRTAQQSASLPPPSRSEGELSLFGREAELEVLWAAFRRTQQGQSSAVHVFGESGSGKSLLLHHFCDEVAREGFVSSAHQPLVVRSRCYERETLPFKALDAAMDAIVDHLSRESALLVSHAMPRDLPALAQLFPALKSLEVTRRLLAREAPAPGMTQLRAQAEGALSELLGRLASQRPFVLWFDDLQWGDRDSIGIISRWLKPPYLPGLMLVFSYRSEEIATSAALRMLRQESATEPSLESQIALQPLGEQHVRALCAQRLENAHWPASAQAQVIDRIVVEAAGSPFLATQLAALAIAQPNAAQDQLAQLTLEDLVQTRSRVLSEGARRMLNVASVAGRPIPMTLAARSARVVREARSCVHELQSLQLIRTRESAGGRLVEVYHDRLREVVQSMLSLEEHLEIDRSLLAMLREAGSADSDWLHTLALAVGEHEAALRYGLEAADRASQKLAFERAAELYERCVGLSPDPSANGGELWQKLALAYAYGGHGSKAANVYLHAAQHVDDERRLQFERAATSQLICSGRFEEGEALLVTVLDRLGLHAPSSEAGLYAALAWERTWIALRGYSYVPHLRSELPFREVFGGEFMGLLSMETASYNPLRAALFQARALRLAVTLGEHEGVARALCAAATIFSVAATEGAQRTAQELLRRAEAIANQIDSSILRTNLASARAICSFLAGQLSEAIELCEQAEHLLRTASADSEYHHRFSLGAARIGALMVLGQFERASDALDLYLQEASDTENISAELHVSFAHAWVDSNQDRAAAAIVRLDRQRKQLPSVGFGLLHTMYMIGVHRTGCVTGEYEWALESVREYWREFQSSVVRRSQMFCMFAYEAHARLLLCRAARRGHQGNLRRELAPHRRALKKLKLPLASAELLRIDARLALAEADKPRAQQLLAASSEAFARTGALDHAARDRFALGALQSGQEGEALQRAALDELRELGIVAPLRELQGYYPELLAEAP